MIIRAKIDYRDLQLQKDIKAGDEYEVSEERGKQIVNANYALEVRESNITVTKSDTLLDSAASKASDSLNTGKAEEQQVAKPKRARKPKETK